MRKTFARWITWFALLAVVATLFFTVQARYNPQPSMFSIPTAKAATCTYQVWNRVAGPTYETYGAASYKVWLYAKEDLYDGAFCGYLHTSIDYSISSGCATFYTAVSNNSGIHYGTTSTGTKCNTSGSLQSSFYHPTYCNYWDATAWINYLGTAEANTGPYYACAV